jgi:hypothetical protein
VSFTILGVEYPNNVNITHKFCKFVVYQAMVPLYTCHNEPTFQKSTAASPRLESVFFLNFPPGVCIGRKKIIGVPFCSPITRLYFSRFDEFNDSDKSELFEACPTYQGLKPFPARTAKT